MAIRSRSARAATALAAALGLAVVEVVSSASHEQDQAAPATVGVGSGPARGASVAMPRGLIGLAITLGLGDARRTAWDGEVTVSEGRVLGLEVAPAAVDAAIEGGRFRVEAKKQAATNKKKAAANKKKAQQKANAAPAPSVVRANLDAPETATVTVRTGEGTFSFRPADLTRGERTMFLDGRAAAEREEAAVRLTGRGTEDDFPSAARAPDGTVWLAYVEYTPEVPHLTKAGSRKEFDSLVPTKHGDRIRLRAFDGTTWSPGVDVTETGLDVWRPAVAVDGAGRVWVAWAQQVDGDWEIFHRVYTPLGPGAASGSWSEPKQVTAEKGSDFHVVATTDAKGRVWLAWQAFRRDNYEVLALALPERPELPHPGASVVSASPADDWGPAIAADGHGGVFVAWDTYDKGNFDVMIRDVARAGPPVAVASSSRFEARPSLAVDRGNRVWVAYEEGDEQWGKDYAHAGSVKNVGLAKNSGFALYVNRTVRLKCLDGGRLLAAAPGAEPRFGAIADRNKSVPRLASGGDGTLWMLVRHHPLPGGQGEVWVGSALAFRRRVLVGAADARQLGEPHRQPARPCSRRRRPAGRLQHRPPAERQHARRGRPLRRAARGDVGRVDHPEARRRPARPRADARRSPPGGSVRHQDDPRLPCRDRREDPAAPARGVPPPHRDQLAQRPGRSARGHLAVRARRRGPRLDGQRRPRQRVRIRVHVVDHPEE